MAVTKALGYGNSISSITSSATLCLLLFFYIFTLGSFIRANIFVLQNGITYDTSFDIFVINNYADHIFIAISLVIWLLSCLVRRLKPFVLISSGVLIAMGILNSSLSPIIFEYVALLSIPIVTVISIYDKYSSNRIITSHSDLLPRYFAIFCVAIGVIATILLVGHFLSIHRALMGLKDYAFDIFVLFSSISGILMILLIFCIPLKVLRDGIITKLKLYRETSTSKFLDGVVTRRSRSIYISLILLLSVVLAIVPHLPQINNNQQLVGSDTSAYVDWLNNLAHSRSSGDFLHKAFHNFGDRPLALILLFGLVKSLQLNASTIIDNLPIILSPALVLVVYLFARELSANDKVSLLASLFTALSFQTLIGAYAGFYANWIALIIGYLGFVFLFKFLKKGGRRNLFLFSSLMVVLLFSHEYTWTILTIVMGAFLLVMLTKGPYQKRGTLLLLIILLSTVILDIAKTTVTRVTNGFGNDMAVAHQQQTGLGQFANRWSNLKDTMIHYGALFSNFIILGLSLYWVLRCNLKESPSILFMIFFSVGILPLLFGDWVVQSRIFYDIPFQIPAALGLSYIKSRSNGLILLAPVCVWLIAITLRDVANFTFPS